MQILTEGFTNHLIQMQLHILIDTRSYDLLEINKNYGLKFIRH